MKGMQKGKIGPTIEDFVLSLNRPADDFDGYD